MTRLPARRVSIPEISILVVDDHPIVCAGIRKLLVTAREITVVGEAHTGQEVLKMVKTIKPDGVLPDREMPVQEDNAGSNSRIHVSQADTGLRQFIASSARGS